MKSRALILAFTAAAAVGCDVTIQAGASDAGASDAGASDAGAADGGVDGGGNVVIRGCASSATAAGSVNGVSIGAAPHAAHAKGAFEYIWIGQNLLSNQCCIDLTAAPSVLSIGFSTVRAGTHNVSTFQQVDSSGLGVFVSLESAQGSVAALSGTVTVIKTGDRWDGTFTFTFPSSQQITGSFETGTIPCARADAGTPCPLSSLEWLSVKRSVEDVVNSTLRVTSTSKAPTSVGSNLNLLHASHSNSQTWSFTAGSGCLPKAVSCQSDNPVGSDPFWVDHDACFELTCDSPNVYKSRAFWTMRPIRSPAVGHAYSYVLGSGAKVTYTPNPNVLWSIDKTVANVTTVSSLMLHNVLFTATDGGVSDLTHTVATVGEAGNTGIDAPSRLTASVKFTRLRADPITATVNLDSSSKPVGSIVGASELGLFTTQAQSDNWHVSYKWTGACEQ